MRKEEREFYHELDRVVDGGDPFDYLAVVSETIEDAPQNDIRDIFAIHVATSVCHLLRGQRMVFDPSEFAKFGLRVHIYNTDVLENLAYMSEEVNALENSSDYIDVLKKYLDALGKIHAEEPSVEIETFAHILAETIKVAILQARKVNMEVEPSNIDNLAAMFGAMKH